MQITRVDWHPEKALRELDRAATVAGERAGARILESAQPRVPRDTGELEASAMVEVDQDGTVTVGYTADHAAFVRGKGVALNGRDPAWLDTAIAETSGDLVDIYADTIRREWS